ncbi:MAG: hypothetical protein ACKOWG_18225 [Planctomycetia bacterium]
MSRTTPAPVASPQVPTASTGAAPRGSWLVAGLVLLGLAAASTGIWFQRHQTRRCLAFYGPEAARRITSAPTVELLLVQPGSGPGRLAARERIDVSTAPGLVHLRRGLVEDANFGWLVAGEAAGAAAPLPAEAWDVALVFREPEGGSTMLVIDFDSAGGGLTVVGQPGRLGVGRIGPGLEKWRRATLGRRTQ